MSVHHSLAWRLPPVVANAQAVVQTELISGLPFPPGAAELLRREQLRCHFSSPFWADAACLSTFSLRLRQQHKGGALWVPLDFLPLQTTQGGGNRAAARSRRFPPDTSSRDGTAAVPLMNASFVEETDLFLFLRVNPLSSEHLSRLNRPPHSGCRRAGEAASHSAAQTSSLAPLRDDGDASPRGGAATHLIHWKGAWELCQPGGLGLSWLLPASACIDAQLRVFDITQAPLHKGQAAACVAGGHEARDYLVDLIAPPENAATGRAGVKADHVWLDEAAVRQFRLSLFRDAFWVPFHWMQSAASHARREAAGELSFLGCHLLNSDQLVMDEHLSALMERVFASGSS